MDQSQKKTVRNRFSKASATYDSYSNIHTQIAKYLFSISNFPSTNEYILEIGSGTGILTKHICQKYSTHQIICLDIAEGMCRELKKKQPGVHGFVGDFEHSPFNITFPFLISSTALQWAKNEHSIAKNISSLLRKEGRFSLAIVMEGTFSELHFLKENLFKLKRTIALPVFTHLKNNFSKHNLELDFCEIKEYKEQYVSVDDIFLAIKSLGIGGVNKHSLNPNELKILKTHYHDYCKKSDNHPFLKYTIGYFTGKKIT